MLISTKKVVMINNSFVGEDKRSLNIPKYATISVALWENFSGGAKVKISKMAPLDFQIAAPRAFLSLY